MPVMAEKNGDRIAVNWERYTRNRWHEIKDAIKAIPGARFRPSNKDWTLPLTMETCRLLREAVGQELTIGADLWAWAADAKAKEKVATGLIDIKNIDLTTVVELDKVPTLTPHLWSAMMDRPYQPVAALYMASMKRCLVADQPGVGKSIETLAALIEQGVRGRVLILAPKTSCLTVWPAEIERWLGPDKDKVYYTVANVAGLTPQQREEEWNYHVDVWSRRPDAIHFFIANAEQAGIKQDTVCPAGFCNGDEDWCPELDKHIKRNVVRRPFIHSVEWDAIVADETHKWLINTRGKSASQVGYGFTKLRTVREDSPKYALSGTPLKGKKINIFGTLNWLWPKVYTSKWTFAYMYFKVTKDLIDAGRKGMIETQTIHDEWKDDAARDRFWRAMSTVMIRRTKAELRAVNPAWMPPEKRYHDVYVPMEGSQKTHYNSMAKGAAANLKGGRLTATGVLAEMTRLKQFANSDGELVAGEYVPTLPSAKFNWLLQFLEERGIEARSPKSKPGTPGDLSDDVSKVVIASQFTKILKLWEAELRDKGINVVSITGETTDRRRKQNMEAFQGDDTIRVCLINTMAGGVSITLDAADDIVLLDETWVPDDQEQVEDRVHRASNVTHQVDVWYVRTKGTIEEDIAKANEDKAMNNHVALDAQRGLRFAAERFGTTIEEEAS
jgi:SNF2 family DNA or RNA helicase